MRDQNENAVMRSYELFDPASNAYARRQNHKKRNRLSDGNTRTPSFSCISRNSLFIGRDIQFHAFNVIGIIFRLS